MKKSVFFSLAALVASMSLSAQKKFKFEQPQTLSTKLVKKTGLQKKAMLPTNEPRIIKEIFTHKDGTVSNKFTAKAGNTTPDNLLTSQTWGELKNIDNNQYQLFQMDSYYQDQSVSTTIKFLDENSIEPTNQFTLELPSSTNYVAVLGQLSTQIGNSSDLRKMFIFVHYFEGGMGPEYQKNAVWVVDENGTVLTKLEGVLANIVDGSNGNKNIVTYESSDDLGATIKVLNNHFDELNTVTIPADLLNYYLGDPLKFLKIKGQNKLVTSHYEKVFLDPDTWEVTPDNHLMINVYDDNLNLENTYKMDIASVFPDEPMTMPQAKFGTFLFGDKYDITDKTFNSDDQLEFLYQIEYYNMLTDKTWTYNYVGNENGEKVLSYEQPISDAIGLQPIAGEEDQAGFILTSLDNGGGRKDGDSGMSVQMFNIKSWSEQFNFPAVYKGDQLSAYYNRIPSAGGYSYLFGLGEGKIENGTAYGVVNQYSKTGELEKAINLNIGQNPYLFIPLLGADYLNPTLFNTDSEMEYTYVHKHNDGTGTLFNTISIAKDHLEPFFNVTGSDESGDLIGSGFVFDKPGSKFIKFAVVHDAITSSGEGLTEFFNIPFINLGTQDSALNGLKVYTDQHNQIVGWTEKANHFAIYDASGRLVKAGQNASQTSTAGLQKGMYVISLQTAKTKVTSKFIVK